MPAQVFERVVKHTTGASYYFYRQVVVEIL